MKELIAFLDARLDEDKQAAWAACVAGDLTLNFQPEDDEAVSDEVLLVHIGRWDPVRVLAEVEAKRQIVDWCEGAIEAGEIKPGTSWNDDAAGAMLGQLVLLLMAQPYAGHEDYNPVWVPPVVTGE